MMRTIVTLAIFAVASADDCSLTCVGQTFNAGSGRDGQDACNAEACGSGYVSLENFGCSGDVATWASHTGCCDTDLCPSAANGWNGMYDAPVGVALTGTTATASTSNSDAFKSNDGNAGTRWQGSSLTEDTDQWLQLAFPSGTQEAVGSVSIAWEASYPTSYEIQHSSDGSTWTTDATEIHARGSNDGSLWTTTVLSSTITAEFFRIKVVTGNNNANMYGASMWEIQLTEGSPNCSMTCTLDSATNVVSAIHDATTGHAFHRCYHDADVSATACACECSDTAY
jgi:hypothetical protein